MSMKSLITELRTYGLPQKIPGIQAYADKGGRIWYWKEGQHKLAPLQENSEGYLRFYYYSDCEEDKKRYRMSVHRAVWLAHKGAIPEGYDIDHDDHNRQNNKLDNLKLLPDEVNRRRTTIHKRARMQLLEIENIVTGQILRMHGIKNAAEAIGVSATSVSRVLRGRQKTTNSWLVREVDTSVNLDN